MKLKIYGLIFFIFFFNSSYAQIVDLSKSLSKDIISISFSKQGEFACYDRKDNFVKLFSKNGKLQLKISTEQILNSYPVKDLKFSLDNIKFVSINKKLLAITGRGSNEIFIYRKDGQFLKKIKTEIKISQIFLTEKYIFVLNLNFGYKNTILYQQIDLRENTRKIKKIKPKKIYSRTYRTYKRNKSIGKLIETMNITQGGFIFDNENLIYYLPATQNVLIHFFDKHFEKIGLPINLVHDIKPSEKKYENNSKKGVTIKSEEALVSMFKVNNTLIGETSTLGLNGENKERIKSILFYYNLKNQKLIGMKKLKKPSFSLIGFYNKQIVFFDKIEGKLYYLSSPSLTQLIE